MEDELWLLGCAHYGEDSQDKGELKRYLTYAKAHRIAIAGMGDTNDIGLCFGTKHIGSVWNNNLTPSKQIDAFVDDFWSVRHQMVGILTGNHEKRAESLTSINPMKVAADRLGVPYFGASKVLVWHGKKIFLAHGASSSESGDFKKVLDSNEGLDAIALAHTHQLTHKRVRRFVINHRGYRSEKTIELVRVGSFLKDADYAKFALHAPTPIGSAFLRYQSKDDTLAVRLGL